MSSPKEKANILSGNLSLKPKHDKNIKTNNNLILKLISKNKFI